MEVYSFNSLQPQQKERLFDFVKSCGSNLLSNSFEDVYRYYGGITFNNGKSFFVLYDRDCIKGTIGIVTREAERRGEIFITALYLRKSDEAYSNYLLEHALKLCKPYTGVKIKLGLRDEMEFISNKLFSLGFSEEYKLMVLKLKALLQPGMKDSSH